MNINNSLFEIEKSNCLSKIPKFINIDLFNNLLIEMYIKNI